MVHLIQMIRLSKILEARRSVVSVVDGPLDPDDSVVEDSGGPEHLLPAVDGPLDPDDSVVEVLAH